MQSAFLFALLLVAAEPRSDDTAGWRIRQEGDRVEIFDRDSHRVGWGRRRPDGSRLGTILPAGPEGAPKVILPERRKRE